MMAGAVDVRDAAASVQAVREPLAAALHAAVASLRAQGVGADHALAWAGAELLAVVASVLGADLPSAADGDPLDEGGPFDMAYTTRHLHIEHDVAAAAARLDTGAIGPTTATTLAALQALQSIAGILAGIARPPACHGG